MSKKWPDDLSNTKQEWYPLDHHVQLFMYDHLTKAAQCPVTNTQIFVFFLLGDSPVSVVMCQRLGTPCLFHLHKRLWGWNRHSIPKRWHLNYRRRWITQKKAYNIQKMAEVWNQDRYFMCIFLPLYIFLLNLCSCRGATHTICLCNGFHYTLGLQSYFIQCHVVLCMHIY
jgi:hypothetical protein